jgi:hypothetical protein
LHCAIADTCKRWLSDGWIFTHIASGEKRDPVTAARLKRVGVAAEFPDLICFGPNGEVACVELLAATRTNLNERVMPLWVATSPKPASPFRHGDLLSPGPGCRAPPPSLAIRWTSIEPSSLPFNLS